MKIERAIIQGLLKERYVFPPIVLVNQRQRIRK